MQNTRRLPLLLARIVAFTDSTKRAHYYTRAEFEADSEHVTIATVNGATTYVARSLTDNRVGTFNPL